MKFRLILGIPLLALGLLLFRCAWTITAQPPETQHTPAEQMPDLVTQTQTYLPGTEITPQTTADLRAWFSTASRHHMPRVFVNRLPADFTEQGDPALFIQVIATLIMRENEQALRERVVLIDLNRKQSAGIPWSSQETLFFNFLVDKYDAGAKRSRESQIADLMKKVDAIPVSMAVAQAALATDWGKQNLSHPFDQKGWIDTQTYDFLPFDSLIQATRSYFREMNGMPPLLEWRVSREQFRDLTAHDKGYRFLPGLYAYMPWDDTYVDRLRAKADEMDVVAVDALTFLPPEIPISFQTAQTVIKTTAGTFTFQTELAESPEQRQRGLMFRTALAPDAGMTFLNKSPRPIGLWMKNTLIPLDMVFFDDQGIVTNVVEWAQPHDETVRMSSGPVKGVVELPAGTIQKLIIKPGDTVSVIR